LRTRIAAPVLAFVLATTAVARAGPFVDVRQWSSDVTEYRDLGTGTTYCEAPHFAPDAWVRFGVADDNDFVDISFVRLDRTWSGSGELALSFDGRAPYVLAARAVRSGGVLALVTAPGVARALLRDLAAATWLTVSVSTTRTAFVLDRVTRAAFSACRAALTAGRAVARPPAGAPAPGPNEVALRPSAGGAWLVDGVINGTREATFEVDSGASFVVLPRSLADGLVGPADFIGWGVFTMADGNTHRQPKYRLHSLRVGGILLTDVVCTVAEHEGSTLLGRSFLGRLKTWSIDPQRGVLRLDRG
jgi:clan AA aspartic protease (TIGR02281 family)